MNVGYFSLTLTPDLVDISSYPQDTNKCSLFLMKTLTLSMFLSSFIVYFIIYKGFWAKKRALKARFNLPLRLFNRSILIRYTNF